MSSSSAQRLTSVKAPFIDKTGLAIWPKSEIYHVPGCPHSDENEIRDFNCSKLLIIVSNSRLWDCLRKRAIKVIVLQLEESNPILNFECSESSELCPQRYSEIFRHPTAICLSAFIKRDHSQLGCKEYQKMKAPSNTSLWREREDSCYLKISSTLDSYYLSFCTINCSLQLCLGSFHEQKGSPVHLPVQRSLFFLFPSSDLAGEAYQTEHYDIVASPNLQSQTPNTDITEFVAG